MEIGWWIIVPPVILVLFLAGLFGGMAGSLLYFLVRFVAKILFPARSRAMVEWMDLADSWLPVGGCVGTGIGYLAGVVVKFF